MFDFCFSLFFLVFRMGDFVVVVVGCMFVLYVRRCMFSCLLLLPPFSPFLLSFPPSLSLFLFLLFFFFVLCRTLSHPVAPCRTPVEPLSHPCRTPVTPCRTQNDKYLIDLLTKNLLLNLPTLLGSISF